MGMIYLFLSYIQRSFCTLDYLIMNKNTIYSFQKRKKDPIPFWSWLIKYLYSNQLKLINDLYLGKIRFSPLNYHPVMF
jgi:hypothetical protein